MERDRVRSRASSWEVSARDESLWTRAVAVVMVKSGQIEDV